jgi:hypothetical protein
MPEKRQALEELHLIVSVCPTQAGTFTTTCVARIGPEDTVQLMVEGARCLEKSATLANKAHFVAGKYRGATLRIYGAAFGSRGRTSRV